MFKHLLTVSILGLASAAAAHATTFTLDVSQITGAMGTGNYGTVVLTQVGSNVTVLETLTSGEVFAKTGAGNALQFNLSTGSIDPATVTGPFSVAVPKNFSGLTFNNAIRCTGCGNGTSAPEFSGPLSFTVDNATIASFFSTGGFYFSADIGVPNHNEESDSRFSTGNVLSDTVPTTSATPEPSSLMLLGTGVLGAAGIVRRRLVK